MHELTSVNDPSISSHSGPRSADEMSPTSGRAGAGDERDE